MTDADRAELAQNLLDNPLLTEAMDALRQEAFAKFLTVEAHDHVEISRLQALANGADEIRNWLEMLKAKAQPNGFDPNEPTREDPGS